MPKRGRVLRRVILCLVLLGLLPFQGWASELPRYARIEILHTNDVHGHLFPFSYGGEENVGGIERRATLIRSIKAQSRDSVVVMDAGDVFGRGPLARPFFGEPDFALMNAVPYDILALGNNEFKGKEGLAGQQVMFDRIRQAQFPVVCANVVRKDTWEHILPPYAILQIGPLRLGVFGLTPPRVADYAEAEGLDILDPIKTARELVPRLKAISDVVIGLTHIGYKLDRQLAAEVPDIDVIVGGDSHTWLHQPEVVLVDDEPQAFWVGGPVIVQAGEWGKALGRLVVYLRRHGEHDYQVMSYRGHLQTVTPDIEPARDISAILAKYAMQVSHVVGSLDREIPREDMPGWLAEVIRGRFEADAGAHSLSGIEVGLPTGRITELDLLKVLPYNNHIVIVEMTPSQFAEFARSENVATSSTAPPNVEKIKVAMESYLAESVSVVADLPIHNTGQAVYRVLYNEVTTH